MSWNNIIGAVALAVALAGCGVGTEDLSSDQGSSGEALKNASSGGAPVAVCSNLTTDATCAQATGCRWMPVAAPCYVLPGQPPQCPNPSGACVSAQSLPPPSDGGVQVGAPGSQR